MDTTPVLCSRCHGVYSTTAPPERLGCQWCGGPLLALYTREEPTAKLVDRSPTFRRYGENDPLDPWA